MGHLRLIVVITVVRFILRTVLRYYHYLLFLLLGGSYNQYLNISEIVRVLNYCFSCIKVPFIIRNSVEIVFVWIIRLTSQHSYILYT